MQRLGVIATRRAGLEPATFGLEIRCPNPQTPTNIGLSSNSTEAPAHNPDSLNENAPPDPDLAAVVQAWPSLPASLRAGIAGLVRAHANHTENGD